MNKGQCGICKEFSDKLSAHNLCVKCQKGVKGARKLVKNRRYLEKLAREKKVKEIK